MTIINFPALLKFIRFHNHHNFLTVVAGAVFFSSQCSINLLEELLIQYIVFGVMLYGGIYTFNGITDAKSDREHPRKRSRPIPSGAISQQGAILWMSFLWVSAFALSYTYEQSLKYWPIYLAFITVNLFYSLYLRGTAYRYLIGITGPMRLYLGVSLVNANAPWTAYGIAFCFMCAVQALKIQLESSSIPSGYRSPIAYLFLGGGLLFVFQPPGQGNFLLFSSVAYIVFLIIPSLFPQVGIYLFGADVHADHKSPLFVAISISLIRKRDYLNLLSFLLLSTFAALNRALIAIEEILLPQLSQISLENVVFILGHQRSGTTYLHKSLHSHPDITTSSFYDLWFSSLTLKFIGQPCKPVLNRLTQYWSTPNHPLNLDEELEEFFWLILLFKSMMIPIMFPSLMSDFALINQCMEYTDNDMIFLKKCLQRVLYKSSSPRLYVGRPLMLTARPELLRQHFPNAKILLCIRSPSDCMLSWTDQMASVTNHQPTERLIQSFMHYIYHIYSQNVFENIEQILCDDLKGDKGLVHPILFEVLTRNTEFLFKELSVFLQLTPICFTQAVSKRIEHHTNRRESNSIAISKKNIASYRRIREISKQFSHISSVGL